jgi:hypothetical protein
MAGQGKKTFVAGEVLLAQDVNDYLMDQSVMNFATVAARSSAIPTPTTGMVSYVGDTGTDTATGATVVNVPQIQAYTGAAWQNIDGLTFISRATVTSGASSVFIDNVFSADFDSYKIMISNLGSNVDSGLLLAIGANASGYYGNQMSTAPYATVSGTVAFTNQNATTSYGTGIIASATSKSGGYIDLQNPFLATTTTLQSFGSDPRPSGFSMRFSAGYHSVASSFTGFTAAFTGATFTTATFAVYGYRKS